LRSGYINLLDFQPALRGLRSGYQRCGGELSHLVDVCSRGDFGFPLLAAGLHSGRDRSVDGAAATGLFVSGVGHCLCLLADALEMSIKVKMHGSTR
jgi:hypothetical protein